MRLHQLYTSVPQPVTIRRLLHFHRIIPSLAHLVLGAVTSTLTERGDWPGHAVLLILKPVALSSGIASFYQQLSGDME
jgi:hypothetical protein